MTSRPSDQAEWIETDGLGGFASGTASGARTRRYHAILLAATTPPTGRLALVNGFDASVRTAAGTFALSSQAYAPGVVHPDGARRIESFETEPWPRWVFRLEDGTRVSQEIFARHGSPVVAVSWRLVEGPGGAILSVRPYLSGRDYHALHHENGAFRFEPDARDGRLTWRPYEGVPGIVVLTNGGYSQQPEWYRSFLYEEERARGLDHIEDLAAPGVFQWDLSRGEAVWILGAEIAGVPPVAPSTTPAACLKSLRVSEKARRARFASPLHRAADGYLVKRGEGMTIVAGYPWFTDWGRDTFIALRGICLSAGRLAEARQILVQWSGAVSQGMLPNRFPDSGESPEYNCVDASLWYVIAVHDYLCAMEKGNRRVAAKDRKALLGAIEAILSGYAGGTRFGIRMDEDGLLAAGVPGVQLTWMDAKVGDWVVTPRIGKPVEVQALWLNALKIGGAFSKRWRPILQRGLASFARRFWNEKGGYLHDVVDVDGRPATADASFRPNQIFAVGGLPMTLLDGPRARRTVDQVESRLWTPMGPRSLAPSEAGYAPRYQGGVRERDSAYHQGTVWPWLAGPFVEAWLRVRGNTRSARKEARARFLAPLQDHLGKAGLGHISEVADAEPPHTPGGCPFQAWSLGELLRLSLDLLADNQE